VLSALIFEQKDNLILRKIWKNLFCLKKIPEYKACAARIEKIHSRELPILGKNRKGASLSEVRRGK